MVSEQPECPLIVRLLAASQHAGIYTSVVKKPSADSKFIAIS